MTYRILQFLILALPFVIVPNDVDCFRSIKESLFQVAALSVIASSFFEMKYRHYRNKFITFFLIYLSLNFFRHFSIPYIWQHKVNIWFLLPMFNTVLGLMMVKIIVENISREEVFKLSRLISYVCFIVSLHLILQKCNIFQLYGRSASFNDANHWISSNRVIGFIGNPMLAGNFLAIGCQFNLLFKEKKHWIFYAVGLAACFLTNTTSGLLAYAACCLVYLLVFHRKIGIMLTTLAGIAGGFAYYHKDFASFSDRWEAWQAAYKLWWERPYTGYGLGHFRAVNVLIKSTRWWQVHNEPLQIMEELGLLGLGFVGGILYNFFRIIRGREQWVMALVVFAGLVSSLMSFPLHIAPLVFLLILGFSFKEILEDTHAVS